VVRLVVTDALAEIFAENRCSCRDFNRCFCCSCRGNLAIKWKTV